MLIIGCSSQPVVPRVDPHAVELMEVDESYQAPMREATLQRWRDRAPEGFRHVLTVWQGFTADPMDLKRPLEGLEGVPADRWGLFVSSDEMRAQWAVFAKQFRILRPAGLHFRSPVGFSPSTRNRDAMRRFFEEIVGDVDLLCVWTPGGLWDREDAQDWASELGLVLAVDPFLEAEFPTLAPGPAYCVLTGPWGGRRRFSDDDLEAFLDFAADHDGPVHAVFRGAERFFWAERLKGMRDALQGGDD